MKERPILFNSEMVRAILEGRKTQTRRVVSHRHLENADICKIKGLIAFEDEHGDHHNFLTLCPYGQPGDRLWVRETFGVYGFFKDGTGYAYRADEDKAGIRWKPSIHMPRLVSRINLEIVSVQVQKLSDITQEDARAEGIADGGCFNCGENEPCGCENPEPIPRDVFINLWQKVYGDGSWYKNPWVWVVEFKRV